MCSTHPTLKRECKKVRRFSNKEKRPEKYQRFSWSPHGQSNSHVLWKEVFQCLYTIVHTRAVTLGACCSPQETCSSAHSQLPQPSLPPALGESLLEELARQTLHPHLPNWIHCIRSLHCWASWLVFPQPHRRTAWLGCSSLLLQHRQHKLCHVTEIKSPAFNWLQEYSGVLRTLSDLTATQLGHGIAVM